MTPLRYQIIEGSTSDEVQERVNELMEDGWSPLGAVSVTVYETVDTGGQNERWSYHQAMTLGAKASPYADMPPRCTAMVECVIPKAPKFVISMIGFNNLVLSKACVESVLANSAPGTFRLILSNNGSTDGTREYFGQMAAQFSDCVCVCEFEENTGFQVPNEGAFAMAVKMGATYFICLNNDAEVPAGWLEKLAAPLDASEKAVLSGPMTGCSRMNERMQGCDDTKLEFIEGSCLCVKILPVYEKWGRLFAPYLDFIYHEDSDLSLRVQYQGWTIHKVPFRILHRGSQTAGAHPEAKARCAEANARNEAVMLRVYAHWNKVRRFDHPILVKRKFAIGDVLLTTPIIRALHAKYPLCPIYVETDYPALFEGNPCVASAGVGPMGTAHGTMVIDLDNSYERTPGRHVLESYAEAAGLEMNEVDFKLEFFDGGDFATYNFIKRRDPALGTVAAIHIGPTTWEGKNWPVDRWNIVAQNLRAKGWKIMLFGNPPKDASMLVDFDMRGQQGYKELAQLLCKCSLFIGVDSFPAHMASALGIPSVVLYGITKASCFAVAHGKYFAVSSDPLHPDSGRRNREANVTYIPTTDAVMRTITVEQVMERVEAILT